MSYLLGIDVGTTRTAAAIQRTDVPPGHAVPEMVTLGDHSVDQPSVVLAAADGTLLVGDAAERRAMAEPDRVAREFKRRIGDMTPVSLGGQPYDAPDLAAVLVRHVVETVTAREGGLPERIALTHPASWGAHKLDLLGEAVSVALSATGLTAPVSWLAEPHAAAVSYAAAERVEPGSTIAVYDLGGGTFDAAVLRKDPAGFTLLGRPEGVEFLGGVDFDEVVFEHVRAGAPGVFAGLDESDPAVWAAVARLRRECREAKEALSADTEVSVPVWLGGAQDVVRLHRGEFEELISDRVEDTVEALRRAIGSAGLGPDQVSSVLLVGGSSRIPLVAQTVSERLGRPVAVDADPKNAIAKGAALALLPGATEPPTGLVGYAEPPTGLIGHGEPPTGLIGHGEPPTGLVGHAEQPTGLVGLPPEPATGYMTPPTEYVAAAPAYDPRTQAWHQDPPTDVFPAVGAGYADHGATTLSPQTPDRGRSPAVLIGAGGLVAAVAVIAALVFWPNEQQVSDATPVLPPVPTTTVAPPPTTDDTPTTEDEPRTRTRTTEPRTSESVAPLPPPVVVPTAPPTTTAPPTPTPTTAPPPTTTTPPPLPR